MQEAIALAGIIGALSVGARKMVARMQEQGHDVLYFENIEGGHGGAADNAQTATLMGLEFAYLWMQLGGR